LQPIEEIGKIAKRHNVMFLVDTAQTAGSVEIDADKIGADLLAFSGHKGLMGVLGTGGLYVREPSLLTPIVTGGTGSNSESVRQPDFMPDMLHSGTMNTPAIAALCEGVRYVIHRGAENIGAHERFLAAYFESELMNVKGIRIYGKKPKIGTVAFNMGNVDSVCIEKLLSDRFAVRAGFHCAPLAHKALGTSDRGAVRVSFGAFSRKYEVKMLIDALYKISKSELG
jgi:selenocysteine lyase/cysteine desulfurase